MEAFGLTVEETRWRIVKALLDEFPYLREKVKEYLRC
jgi:hypothetical protein